MADREELDMPVLMELNDGTYTRLPENLKVKTGITQYALHPNPGAVIWSWILEFDTTQVSWIYKFTDETGDEYTKTISDPGHYSLKYNSERPNIVRLRG